MHSTVSMTYSRHHRTLRTLTAEISGTPIYLLLLPDRVDLIGVTKFVQATGSTEVRCTEGHAGSGLAAASPVMLSVTTASLSFVACNRVALPRGDPWKRMGVMSRSIAVALASLAMILLIRVADLGSGLGPWGVISPLRSPATPSFALSDAVQEAEAAHPR
jgi:hypothetical protein